MEKRPGGGSGSTGAARWVSASAVVSDGQEVGSNEVQILCYCTSVDFLGVCTGLECGMEK